MDIFDALGNPEVGVRLDQPATIEIELASDALGGVDVVLTVHARGGVSVYTRRGADDDWGPVEFTLERNATGGITITVSGILPCTVALKAQRTGQSHIGMRGARHSREGGNPAPRSDSPINCRDGSPGIDSGLIAGPDRLFAGVAVSSSPICDCPKKEGHFNYALYTAHSWLGPSLSESKRGLLSSLAPVAIPPSWLGLVRGAARTTVGRSPYVGWHTDAQGQLGTCPGLGCGRPIGKLGSHYQDNGLVISADKRGNWSDPAPSVEQVGAAIGLHQGRINQGLQRESIGTPEGLRSLDLHLERVAS